VATDLSDLSNQGVLPAYGVLRAGGGRVELCHVHERGEHGSVTGGLTPKPPLGDAEKGQIHQRLRALIPPEAEARGILTNTSVLEGASAAQAILAAALRLDVDLIALASHGRSGVKRALLGSVAEQVARDSARPVLIVHLPKR
jgi:nucleotide-binding universal stress UspA family protein